MFITVFQIFPEETTVARFRKQRSQLEFVEGARHSLTDTPLPEIIASWKEKAQSDRIVLALPPALFSIREMELPIPDKKKAREILPLELKGETALESDEMIFDLIPMAEGRYTAIWSSKSRLATHVAALADAGLDPEILTSPMFCWKSLAPAVADGCCALTDGEAVAIYRDGTPIYLRGLPPAGEDRISPTITAAEMAKAITVEQLFHFGAKEPEETFLDVSPLPITPALAATFPGNQVAARDLASLYAAAAELIAGDPVNFRRGPLAFTRRQREMQRKLRFTAILAAAVITLLFTEAGVRYYLLKRDLDSLDKSIRKIYTEAFPKRSKPVDEVAELKAEIRRLTGSSAQTVLPSLKKLAEAKGEEITELYEIEIEGAQVSGKGTARSAQAVSDFKSKCTPLFSSFDVNETKSKPDGSTGFSFKSSMKEAMP